MKRIELYLVALLSIFVLAACGGGDDSGSNSSGGNNGGGNYTPKSYTQSVTLPAKGGDMTVALSSLSSEVSSISNTPSWLVVTREYYFSGAPTVKFGFEDNNDGQERKAAVTVTASSGDKVVLTITQQATGGSGGGGTQEDVKKGIEDIHNEYTSQPAYTHSYKE
jgi:hypothetical protein